MTLAQRYPNQCDADVLKVLNALAAAMDGLARLERSSQDDAARRRREGGV